jgi:hypothetical protein
MAADDGKFVLALRESCPKIHGLNLLRSDHYVIKADDGFHFMF